MKRPWMKFYPADWRADPRLRICSLAARGVWIELIGYMHEGHPYGHMTIDGEVPSLDEIASLLGRPVAEVQPALEELERRNVFSRSESGAIVSRKMVRNNDKSEEGRRQVEKRWGKEEHRPPNRSAITLDTRYQKLEDSLSPPIPAQPRESESEGKSGRGKKTPLPIGWAPSEASLEEAVRLGLTEADIAQQVTRFRNHARQEARKCAGDVGWDAAFANWCDKAAERLGRESANDQPTTGERQAAVFIREGTDQWDAWQVHLRATTGRGSPIDKNGGWYRPSEWPPAGVAVAEAR